MIVSWWMGVGCDDKWEQINETREGPNWERWWEWATPWEV